MNKEVCHVSFFSRLRDLERFYQDGVLDKVVEDIFPLEIKRLEDQSIVYIDLTPELLQDFRSFCEGYPLRYPVKIGMGLRYLCKEDGVAPFRMPLIRNHPHVLRFIELLEVYLQEEQCRDVFPLMADVYEVNLFSSILRRFTNMNTIDTYKLVVPQLVSWYSELEERNLILLLPKDTEYLFRQIFRRTNGFLREYDEELHNRLHHIAFMG